MSKVFLANDVLTFDTLRSAVDRAMAEWNAPEPDYENLGEYLACHSDIGERLASVERKLDRLMEHLGCDATE